MNAYSILDGRGSIQCEELVREPGRKMDRRCTKKATTTVAQRYSYLHGATVSMQLCTFHNPAHKAARKAKRGPTAFEVRQGLSVMYARDSTLQQVRIKELEQQVQALQDRILEFERKEDCPCPI
jgi:hypothetical protein